MRTNFAAYAAAVVVATTLVLCPGSAATGAEQIVLAGQVVARISAPGDSGSVTQRAAEIDRRVAQALSTENVGTPRMAVRAAGGAPAIFIGQTMLMRVYPPDARPYKCSPAQLAKQWAANFARQFPLAEPCTRLSSHMAAGELSRAQARTAGAAAVRIPPQDWAIVSVIVEHLASARALTGAQFQEQTGALTCALYRDVARGLAHSTQNAPVARPPHAPGQCPEKAGCPACKAAWAAAVAGPEATAGPSPAIERRIRGGLELMRRVDEPRYLRDRAMVAWTLLTAIRKHDKPDG